LINLTGDGARAAREQIRTMADEPTARAGEKPRDAKEAGPQSSGGDDSWLDPDLLPSSTVEYESHGAKVTNFRIENSSGRSVNVLRFGQKYTAAYEIILFAEVRSVAFGFQVKTISGVVLAGANNADVPERQLAKVGPDERYAVRFDFFCRFTPGTYLIDAGVMG